MTCSDAVQAFLQTWLDKDDWTLIILPVELWKPDWKTRFGESAKLAVRLQKSLSSYGWEVVAAVPHFLRRFIERD